MIYRDLICKNCGSIKTDVKFKSTKSEILNECDQCGFQMYNVCNCGGFKLKYDNKKDSCGWSDSNYASSQYYNEVN